LDAKLEIKTQAEQTLWLKYYEMQLAKGDQVKSASTYADQVLWEFKSRNQYNEFDD
jgi:hypothetical protein